MLWDIKVIIINKMSIEEVLQEVREINMKLESENKEMSDELIRNEFYICRLIRQINDMNSRLAVLHVNEIVNQYFPTSRPDVAPFETYSHFRKVIGTCCCVCYVEERLICCSVCGNQLCCQCYTRVEKCPICRIAIQK